MVTNHKAAVEGVQIVGGAAQGVRGGGIVGGYSKGGL